MPDQAASIIFNNIAIGYGKAHSRIEISRSLTGSLSAGSLTALIGRNGMGKSTLLRTLAGFLLPLEGEVRINGIAAAELSRTDFAKNVAVVLTKTEDTGYLSAYDIVSMGRLPYTGLSGRLSREDTAICQKSLRDVGATHLAKKNFRLLSDGEKQRIMIAKALAQDTPFILLDEPTAFLDYPSKLETMELLRRLAHEEGKAILFSCHDVDMAVAHADQIWLLRQNGIENMQSKDFELNMLYE